jgi:hypothetical protein
MEARQRVEFTGVELTSGAELTAPMEKAATDPVEKATAGLRAGEAHGRRGAQWRGRRATMLQRGGDAGRRSGGTMEREARWRGGVVERGHGELSHHLAVR